MKATKSFHPLSNLLMLAVVLLVAIVPFSAIAQESAPKLRSTHGDWAVYTFKEDGNQVCYMASRPKETEGNYTRRGDVFAFVTHRPAENALDVFSYITGYTYKPSSNVTVKIDNQTFTLFTQGDMAWTSDAQTDKKLTEAIKRGSKMIVKGTSSRGTLTTDTFSLNGSLAAHNKMSNLCDAK